MNEIKVVDKAEILGKDIQVIEGGFGDNQKVILASQVADIHETETKYINRLINDNIEWFDENDLIDLKGGEYESPQLESVGISKMSILKSNNIFLLSERGYMTLVGLMDNSNKTKKEAMQEIKNKYFSMRKELREIKNEKEELLLQLFSNDPLTIANAHKKLVEIETKPLLEKIEEDKPLVGFAETCIKSSDSILVRELAKLACDEGINIGQNKLYNKLRDWNYILKGNTEPTQYAMDRGYFEVVQRVSKTPYGEKIHRTTKVKPKGQVQIIERLKREVL